MNVEVNNNGNLRKKQSMQNSPPVHQLLSQLFRHETMRMKEICTKFGSHMLLTWALDNNTCGRTVKKSWLSQHMHWVRFQDLTLDWCTQRLLRA